MGRSILSPEVGGSSLTEGCQGQLFGRMIVAADISYWSVVKRGEDRYLRAMARVADAI
jgi:hypothetical protein